MNPTTTFGPYHLLERVSVGGMAEVFKAIEYGADGFEREVAVKRILPHVAEDEEFITMFKDEAHIAVQLQHSNIAQIYNLGFENDSFYIALEFVLGKDVRAIFEKGRQTGAPMPIAQACFTVMQVCEGLDYAHNKKDKVGRPLNIVHRDVSPPNILVSYEGEVKLIDFGVAKAAGRASHTQSGILKGKFGYMSPEQVKGRALDRRSDVFALGVVLWEVLCGRRLFQGDTDFATLEMVRAVEITNPSQINPNVSPKLEAIVLKVLAAEPDARYQSAMELHDALQAFMFEEGIFASRKDLATWMRQQYAAEIEDEKRKAHARGAAGSQGTNKGQGVPKKTMMMGPGNMMGAPAGAPPSPPPGRGPPPPKPQARRSPPPKPGGGPPSRPSAVATQAHKVVSANVPQAGPPKPSGGRSGGPPKPGGRGGRVRAKTMLMSPKQAPVRSAPKPKPARPKPKPVAAKAKASYEGPTQGSDFDWDDDELETRLFDAPGGAATGAAGREPAAPAPRPAAKPIAVAPAQQARPAVPPAPAPAPRTAPPVAQAMAAVPVAVMSEPTSYGASTGNSQKVMLYAVIGVLFAAIVSAGLYLALSGGETPASPGSESATSTASADTAVVAGPGSVSLTLSIADAEVSVDGALVVGAGSPRVLSDISAGSHKIKVSKGDEFLPFEQEITVAAGEALPLDVKLESAKVELTVKSSPKSISLSLVTGDKAEPMGKGTTVKHSFTRVAGRGYSLRAQAKGYITADVPVVFDGAASQEVSINLVKDPGATPTPTPAVMTTKRKKKTTKKKKKVPKVSKAKTATLRIGVSPGNPPADVYVDGKKQSKKTPVFVKVSPGKHTVKWKWGSKSSSQRVSVGDGESKTVKGKK